MSSQHKHSSAHPTYCDCCGHTLKYIYYNVKRNQNFCPACLVDNGEHGTRFERLSVSSSWVKTKQLPTAAETLRKASNARNEWNAALHHPQDAPSRSRSGYDKLPPYSKLVEEFEEVYGDDDNNDGYDDSDGYDSYNSIDGLAHTYGEETATAEAYASGYKLHL